MKFIKRLIMVVVVLVLVGIAVSAGAWFMLRGTPEWYQPDTTTDAQRQAAFERARNMYTRMTNWAGAARARSHQASSGDRPNATTTQADDVMAHEPDQPFQIQFTDAELNAFFNTWVDNRGRRAMFDKYVDHPRLVLRDQQLIVAGNVKELGTVVSMQFEPRIDSEGRLQMNLVRVLGGILPLPDAMWADQRDKIEHLLASKLPALQRDSRFAPDGTANASAASASMNKLLWSILHREPADPVVFVPCEQFNLAPSIPTKITAVSIQNDTLTMTVQQMTGAERESLMERLRSPAEDATAMSR
jgi:hypothetical protein